MTAPAVAAEVPAYEVHVNKQIKRLGLDHPLFLTQYALEEVDSQVIALDAGESDRLIFEIDGQASTSIKASITPGDFDALPAELPLEMAQIVLPTPITNPDPTMVPSSLQIASSSGST